MNSVQRQATVINIFFFRVALSLLVHFDLYFFFGGIVMITIMIFLICEQSELNVNTTVNIVCHSVSKEHEGERDRAREMGHTGFFEVTLIF